MSGGAQAEARSSGRARADRGDVVGDERFEPRLDGQLRRLEAACSARMCGRGGGEESFNDGEGSAAVGRVGVSGR